MTSPKDLTKIMNDAEEIIVNIRKRFADCYDISENSEFARYTGLCDPVSADFIKEFNSKYHDTDNNPVAIIRHGEIRHSPFIAKSKYWPYQHTWVEIKVDNKVIYVDGTLGQFSDILNDVPDYCIRQKKHKWFLDDRDNIAYGHKVTRFINEHTQIERYIKDIGDVHDGLIEFLQYEVWGRISDVIRRWILHETK